MMMVTLVGLGIIAVGAKIVQLVQEKMNNKKQDNHEDCCG